MDLRSFRHIVALARHLNYTKASRELGISQSALSRSVQSIEQQAGVRLFDRDRGGVHLTSVGKTFVDQATALLRDANHIEQSLRRAAGGTESGVVFGMTPVAAAALLSSVLTENLISHPDLRYQ